MTTIELGGRIATIATLIVVLAFVVVNSILSSRAIRLAVRRREQRTPTEDAKFETAFEVVAMIVGRDLGVDYTRLLPGDLLEHLGYCFKNSDWDDSVDSLYELIAESTKIDVRMFHVCSTLGELARNTMTSPRD